MASAEGGIINYGFEERDRIATRISWISGSAVEQRIQLRMSLLHLFQAASLSLKGPNVPLLTTSPVFIELREYRISHYWHPQQVDSSTTIDTKAHATDEGG